ncbi:hypothetical protein FQN60_012634, partial [Etheostoma spectabile]
RRRNIGVPGSDKTDLAIEFQSDSKRRVDESVEKRRGGLMVYLTEKDEDLFKKLDGGDIVNEVMKIVISRGATMSDSTSARIFIEGTEVLQDLDVPRACALLMGVIYGLNLSYPKEGKNTFEVLLKIFLELDGLKASLKVMSLKTGHVGLGLAPSSPPADSRKYQMGLRRRTGTIQSASRTIPNITGVFQLVVTARKNLPPSLFTPCIDSKIKRQTTPKTFKHTPFLPLERGKEGGVKGIEGERQKACDEDKGRTVDGYCQRSGHPSVKPFSTLEEGGGRRVCWGGWKEVEKDGGNKGNYIVRRPRGLLKSIKPAQRRPRHRTAKFTEM